MKAVAASVVAAAAASVCCIGPVVAAVLGAGALAWIPTPLFGTNKSGLLAKDESELLPTQPRDRDGLAVNAGGEQ